MSTIPSSVSGLQPYDLFIVYSPTDRAWVDGYLKHALGLDPVRVLTREDFTLGASVAAEFERGVTTSRFTLLVLSPAFLADRWTEFGEGLVSFSAVEEGRNRLVTLTLHDCNAPLRLRSRVTLDCTVWEEWDARVAKLRELLDAPEPTIQAVPCPYPGMVPFRKEDARFFHGRDDEIQRLLTDIRHHHFLIVIGSSGSGKSSLVTAGLLPKLDDPRNFPPGTWRVLTMRPGAKPIEELARTLPTAPDGSAAAISAALAVEPPAQRLLLVVDQFEELFSQVKDSAIREAFLGHLKALRSDPRCTVMMTMRADFYGDLMNSALWPIDKSEIIEVVPLRGESLRQAIVKPAESAGVYLEEGLVERLLADAADEPGALPMLQEALVLLWGTMSGRLLTRASYMSLGREGRSGLAVAMATKADATLAALPPDQQRIARRIFLRLVQFGEGRPDTRRQLGVDELRAETDEPRAFDDLLQHLISNRLLTPSADEVRGLRVDIAHEMLIIGWPASRDWVESRREAEKTRRRLVDKAVEWVRLGRAESGLLDLAELVEADAWLSGPDAAELGVDSDVQAQTLASRLAIDSLKRRKKMRTRVAIGGLTTALFAISALAVWGELKRRDAVKARELTEITAAEGLFRPLVRGPGDLNDREIEALQQLGGLKPDQEGVRIKFLVHALGDASRSSRLANRMPVALQAAVGLDPGRREQVLQLLRGRLADRQATVPLKVSAADAVTELDSSDPSTNEVSLRILLEAFATSEKTLDGERLVADIANRLVRVMETLPADQQGWIGSAVADALAKANYPLGRQPLAERLGDLTKAMPPERAANLLDAPARTLANALLAKPADAWIRRDLAAGLAALAKAMPPERAANLLDAPARTLADAIDREPNQSELRDLAAGLAALAKALPPERAANLLDSLARTLADALAKPNYRNLPTARQAVASELAELVKALPPERAANLLADALAKETYLPARQPLAAGLADLAKAMSPERAANLLADALAKETYLPARQPLAAGLADLAKAMSPERASGLLEFVAHTLADAIDREPYSIACEFLAADLAVVARAMPPERGANLLESPARALANALSKRADPRVAPFLARGLSELAKAMPPEQGASLLADALANQIDSAAAQPLAAGLAALAKALPPERVVGLLESRARTLADAIDKPTNAYVRRELAAGLAALAKALPSERAANLLESPARTLADAMDSEHAAFGSGALAAGLAALAKALPPERAANLLESPARTLTDGLLTKPTKPILSSTLDVGEGLAELAKAMPPERGASLLADALAKKIYPDAGGPLARGLAELAKALPPERGASLLADALAKAKYRAHPTERRALVAGLTVLAKALPPERAAGLLEAPTRTLADALDRELTSFGSGGLAADLAALAKALPPERAANLLEAPARTLADALAKQTSPSARQVLVTDLAALAKALPPERAASLLEAPARTLADALAKQTDSSARRALAAGLAELARPMPPERIADLLIDSDRRSLGLSDPVLPALRELAGRASLEQQVDWLKRPLCYGEARQAILSQVKTPEGKTFQSHWELVEWLQKNRPKIDLTSPPIDPGRSSQR